MFGEADVDAVLAESDACHQTHPNNHICLMDFDNFA